MRVVLTGAAGLTGGELTSQLVAQGHEVRAVVRRPVDVPGAAAVAVGDLADPATMGPFLRGTDVLVHGAGILEGTRLAAVPGISEIPRLVVVSSAGVYSRHRASAAAYREGEAALVRVARTHLIVRPTMIYGSERDRNVHRVVTVAARTGVLPLFGSGEAMLQPIHFADLATALAALVGTGSTGTIDAGGGAPLTVRELIEAVFAALGRRARVIRLPLGPSLAMARAADRLRGDRIAERLERLTEDRSVDNERLVRLTGVRPRTFHEGVRDEVRRLRQIGRIA